MGEIKEILSQTAHRQYPLPKKPWKYYQQWEDVLMLHYKADAQQLEKMLPAGLTLDRHEGQAWVSLYTFSVRKLRPRFLPPLPYISNFNEVNLRTYVVRDGIPGIYMLAIQADKLADVLMPRWLLGIPYVKSEMHSQKGYFFAENKQRSHKVKAIFYPKEIINEKDGLDFWLTERHALYVDRKKKLYRFDIHHKQWRLRDVAIISLSQNYTQGFATTPQVPQRQHYARKIKVVIWGRKAIR